VITEGLNGRLAPPLDAGAFVRIIGELQADPEGRAALAAKAEAHARQRLGWEPVAARHVEVLGDARAAKETAAAVQRSRRLAFSGWMAPSSRGGGA